jgi:hypothetical protein
MAVREILLLGHPGLYTKCVPVQRTELEKLQLDGILAVQRAIDKKSFALRSQRALVSVLHDIGGRPGEDCASGVL